MPGFRPSALRTATGRTICPLVANQNGAHGRLQKFYLVGIYNPVVHRHAGIRERGNGQSAKRRAARGGSESSYPFEDAEGALVKTQEMAKNSFGLELPAATAP